MQAGKIFIVSGIILIVVGIIIVFAENKPGIINWFGSLPGDIRISKKNMRIYFPIVSMLLISLILTIILNLFRKFFH